MKEIGRQQMQVATMPTVRLKDPSESADRVWPATIDVMMAYPASVAIWRIAIIMTR